MKKIIKKITVSIIAMVMALSAFAFGGCDFNSVKDTVKDTVNDITDSITGTENESVKPSYDGTIVQAGQNFELSNVNKIAFLSSDIISLENEEYTPVSITLTATVVPSYANQELLWLIEFVNADGEWARGKNVTDYIELTNKSQSSVDITCKAPFGEQIKIICMSKANPEIFDTCIVDFFQSLSNVSLRFGENLPINLGGQTDVSWEVSPTNAGIGGMAIVDYTTYSTCTVDDTYTWDIDLISPEYFVSSSESTTETTVWGENGSLTYNDGFLIIDSSYIESAFFPIGETDIGLFRLENITDLTFDYDFLQKSTIRYSIKTGEFFSFYDNQELLVEHFNDIKEGSLYTLRLQITGDKTNKVYEYVSLINLTEFTNNATVQSLSLSQKNWQINS